MLWRILEGGSDEHTLWAQKVWPYVDASLLWCKFNTKNPFLIKPTEIQLRLMNEYHGSWRMSGVFLFVSDTRNLRHMSERHDAKHFGWQPKKHSCELDHRKNQGQTDTLKQKHNSNNCLMSPCILTMLKTDVLLLSEQWHFSGYKWNLTNWKSSILKDFHWSWD